MNRPNKSHICYALSYGEGHRFAHQNKSTANKTTKFISIFAYHTEKIHNTLYTL